MDWIDEVVNERFDDLRVVVITLSESFSQAGYQLYLVGGVVRNALIAGESTTPDFDLTTDAPPDEIRALVADIADAVWHQGERFGTVGVRIGEHTLEITTHRSEAYVDHSRQPVVTFSADLDLDLVRRDFTVNAMAVNVADGVLHDPCNGQLDLEAGVLRTPLPAEESFSDDPLRMLRAARFVAGYSLEPAAGLVEAAARLSERLSVVSAERIQEELRRLLMVDDPRPGLHLLVKMGLLERILPEIAALDESRRNTAFDQVPLVWNDPLVRLVALLLDLEPADVENRVRALRFSRQEAMTVVGLVRIMKKISSGPPGGSWSAENVRRLAVDSGALLGVAVDLAAVLHRDIGGLAVAVEQSVTLGDLEDLGPALDGDQVMAALALDPGPQVGEALAWLVDLRLREGKLSIEDAQGRLVDWWQSR